MPSFAVGHVIRVRKLYKAILRLHRGLPSDLRIIGDEYVKAEFKKHTDADAAFAVMFMQEWAVCQAVTIYEFADKPTNQPTTRSTIESPTNLLKTEPPPLVVRYWQAWASRYNTSN